MILEDTLGCEWAISRLLIISENVFDALVYYSHLFPLVIAVGLGIFVFLKNYKTLVGRLFLALTIAFGLWIFSDLVLWSDPNPNHIMFFWSLTILFEPIIYILGLYFLMVYANGGDISDKTKWTFLALLLPTILFLPTKLSILGFNYTNCDREVIESLLVYYGYFVELIITFWSLIFAIRAYSKTPREKRGGLLFTVAGVLLFFAFFASGNIIGSISENWTFGQYGLFGMPIMFAFLTYAITRYHTFSIKTLSTEILVICQALLVGSLLLIDEISYIRIVVAITLGVAILLGWALVRSVKKEVEQREHIEKLALDLEKANARLRELDQMKSQFLSFASHQIRSPLTAIKGYTSMALEGDFGEMPEKIKGVIETLDKSAQSLIVIVNEFLDVSRIEQGRMKYEMSDFDVRKLVEETVAELRPNVEQKGLKFTFDADVKHDYRVYADQGKIKQVIGNIVDNAIKYTPSGSIDVKVSRTKSTVNITVSDTGVGIEPDVIPKLFSMFGRAKDASKTNVTGTGLGLYVAKQMIEAHRGQIWIESEGKGKGSTFHIELPAKN